MIISDGSTVDSTRGIRHRARTARSVAIAVALAGLGAAFYYAQLGLTLSHYDAKGHLVVARRIIDSLTPGWRQIGAVWLPLPHLLNFLPVQIDAFYRSGASGVAISIASAMVLSILKSSGRPGPGDSTSRSYLPPSSLTGSKSRAAMPTVAATVCTFVVVCCAAAATVVLCAAAVVVSGRAAAELGQPDPPRVIIDEIAGMWVAALALPLQWYDLCAVFLLFRLFDVVKPAPIPDWSGCPGDSASWRMMLRPAFWLGSRGGS